MYRRCCDRRVRRVVWSVWHLRDRQSAAPAQGDDPGSPGARGLNLTAINSNDLDSICSAYWTEDVVFLAAQETPVMVGRQRCGRWLEDTSRAFKTPLG